MSIPPNENLISKLCRLDLQTEVLAVKKVNVRGQNKVQLCILSRNKITCWQLFLRVFGRGCLAGMDFNLKSVVQFLNRSFNWHKVADPRLPSYQSYKKVCCLANKALLSKGEVGLYTGVSFYRVPIKNSQGDFLDDIFLNPCATTEVLNKYLKEQGRADYEITCIHLEARPIYVEAKELYRS